MKLFRIAAEAPTRRHVAATLLQTAMFWATFLLVLPELIVRIEAPFGVDGALRAAGVPPLAGIVLFVVASALGLWTGVLMAVRGRGTPLPLLAARELVAEGPYRAVRNPMALAGITQGVAVGLWRGSTAVVLYALAGALLWHVAVRPAEETFLAQRFGASFDRYRERVPLWLPRVLPPRGERWLGAVVAAATLGALGRALVPWPPDRVAAWAALPLPAAGVLVGAVLWTRGQSTAGAGTGTGAGTRPFTAVPPRTP